MAAIACPSRAELVAWRSGRLERERLQAVAEHVEHCPACLATVEALDPAGPPASATVPDRGGRRTAATRPGTPDPDSAAGSGSAPTLPLQLGAYQILEELGRGGMGAVYKARHTRLKRVVALKTVTTDRLHDPQILARFEREMEAIGKLDHPNIVRASDAGEAGGVHFLVMEFVAGSDLSRLVKRRGPLHVADACEIIRQAAEGLEHVYRQGLVHRDIKPQNLMLTPDGRVKLLDLGLARLWGDQPPGEELTATGQIMGTADYMAPEQAADTHPVDIRADLYSLGCTLYYLLTGRAPFQCPEYQTTWSKQAAHAREPVPRIRGRRPEVPEALTAVLDRLLAKDPAGRFQVPAEVAVALTPWAAGSRLPALFKAEVTPTAARATEQAPDPSPSTALVSSERSATTTTPYLPPLTKPAMASTLTPNLDESTQLPPKAPSPRRKVPIAVAAGLLGFAGLFLAWKGIVRLKDKEGKTRAEIQIPGGGTVEVEQGGRVRTVVPSPKAEGPPPLAVAPFPAAEAKQHQGRWASHLGRPEIETNTVGMKLVLIPAGEFQMGSPDSDSDAEPDEKPQHRVRITRPFYLGATQVTIGQFRRFVEAAGYRTEAERDGKGDYGWDEQKGTWVRDSKYSWRSPGFEQTDEHPVVFVSWNDAVAFCGWVSRQEGQPYRLPTEAEWEYACRAGTTTRYSSGGDAELLATVANVADATARAKFPDWETIAAQDGYVFTAQVGRFRANAWGVHDMHGNVWEWCSDGYDAGYYRRSPVDDPPGILQAPDRVNRGGCWDDTARFARSANRGGHTPGSRNDHLGFRVARVQSGR